MLGLSAEQLREELRRRRDQLPARDPKHPNLFTKEFVDALRSALDKERATSMKAKDGGGSAVIFSVTSGKGGVGKTSLAVNIATEFSKRGYRTVLVDTDLGLANTQADLRRQRREGNGQPGRDRTQPRARGNKGAAAVL
ncbi:MAG: nucleotide-binding protein [Planctomycetota bacterium]